MFLKKGEACEGMSICLSLLLCVKCYVNKLQYSVLLFITWLINYLIKKKTALAPHWLKLFIVVFRFQCSVASAFSFWQFYTQGLDPFENLMSVFDSMNYFTYCRSFCQASWESRNVVDWKPRSYGWMRLEKLYETSCTKHALYDYALSGCCSECKVLVISNVLSDGECT